MKLYKLIIVLYVIWGLSNVLMCVQWGNPFIEFANDLQFRCGAPGPITNVISKDEAQRLIAAQPWNCEGWPYHVSLTGSNTQWHARFDPDRIIWRRVLWALAFWSFPRVPPSYELDAPTMILTVYQEGHKSSEFKPLRNNISGEK